MASHKKKKFKWQGYYFNLLLGLGISQLGNWIYLIALNIYVLNLSQSPAAVAGLYIVGPVTRIMCSFIVGTYIDRWNKKQIVIATDVIRGFLVCLMPFANELWLVYLLVACTNIASTLFGPSSTYLISTLVDDKHKLHFNSIHSTLSSGSFMIGPALAGGIIAISNTSIAMWVNGVTFFICAVLLARLPNRRTGQQNQTNRITFSTIKEDWKVTLRYSKTISWFSYFLVVYSIALMIAFALDSQEMTFLLTHLHISESLYGVTITIAGIGAIVGGIAATALAKAFTVSAYIKVGFSFSMLSYLIFYATHSYIVAVISFVCLGFSMAFSNSGFATLYQKVVKPELMGSFGSMVNLIQSIVQVCITLVLGLFAEWFSLQWTAVIFASVALLLSIHICMLKLTEHKAYKAST